MSYNDASIGPAGYNPRELANAIRALSMDAVEQAGSGHPGMPMGMADVAMALWTCLLKHNPDVPDWPDRDRFVLSVGHGSMLLYSLLYLTGYPRIGIKDLERFRQLGSRTCGHPEYDRAAGIETTTGPLGQGLTNAVGMALAERHLAARFGESLVDHRTYCFVGDGCLMEGIAQEALSFAAHQRLGKLMILFDDNGISIDGRTSLATSEDHVARCAALGFDVHHVDGHDPVKIAEALYRAHATTDRPSFIACTTTIAYGAPTKAGSAASHGAPLGTDEIRGAREALDWPHPPFTVPETVLRAWRESANQSRRHYQDWQTRLQAADPETRAAYQRAMDGTLPEDLQARLHGLKADFAREPKREATRKSSQTVLASLAEAIPELVGGSADLSGSNLTKVEALEAMTPENPAGRYIHYGVREHAMGGLMNGMTTHGGLRCYGGTFLVFSDYMRPAIRLSALMEIGVIYVMTHDSIGVGEDGPTHQPVEHLASLRAIPNLRVYRPADRVETLECWELALTRRDGPSLIALTRQAVDPHRREEEGGAENRCARGGYVLHDPAGGSPELVLVATGSELSLAAQAGAQLAQEGIRARLVSLPCMELFLAQPKAYREAVLPPSLPRLGIEAGCSFGWERLLPSREAFIGVDSFGTSAPGPDVYRHLGLTAEAIVAKAKSWLASTQAPG